MLRRSSDPREFLNALHKDHLFEIRILRVGHSNTTFGGFFDSIDAAISQMESFEARHKPKAIYCTLNTFEPGPRKRWSTKNKTQFEVNLEVTNSITPRGSGTLCQNDDIAARRWLFIDIDPIRPTGINSSDIQHDAAIAMAQKIRDDMANAGWPMPILGMSGNGAYLLWRVDFKESEHPNLISSCVYAIVDRYSPNAKDAKDAIESAIQAGTYSDEENAESTAMDIDKSVHNAARICKILGTQSRKGTHSDLRPQRQSWFDLPDVIGVVPVEKLQELSATLDKKRRKHSSAKSPAENEESSRETLPADDPMMREEIEAVLKKWSRVPIDVQKSISNDYETWRAAGCCLHFTHDSLYSRWIELSKLSSKFDESACRAQWNGFTRPSPGPDGEFGGNVITDRWINKYLPNDFNAHKEIRELLALTLDIDNQTVQERIWKNFQLWNKSQDAPHTESELLVIFSMQLRQRIFAMSQKGHKTGLEAIESSSVDVIPDATEGDNLSNSIRQADDVSKILEGKDTLSEDDKAKVFKSNAKVARNFSSSLSDTQLEIISGWQLYLFEETPVCWELSLTGVSGRPNVTVELSTQELRNFVLVGDKLREHQDYLPTSLAKKWGDVVNELTLRSVKMQSNRDRDCLPIVAECVIGLCLCSTASIDNMDKKTSMVNTTGMQRGQNVFYEGPGNNVSAFWINYGIMITELSSHCVWLKGNERGIRQSLSKLGIKTGREASMTPRKLRSIAACARMACIDKTLFDHICHIAGMPCEMALYSYQTPSVQQSAKPAFEKLGSTNLIKTPENNTSYTASLLPIAADRFEEDASFDPSEWDK